MYKYVGVDKTYPMNIITPRLTAAQGTHCLCVFSTSDIFQSVLLQVLMPVGMFTIYVLTVELTCDNL